MLDDVTVVIPHLEERSDFLNQYVLPAIGNQLPEENIIVVPGEYSGAAKRNEGLAKAKTPYVFFCDDDVILADNALQEMITVLKEAHHEVDFVYSQYYAVNHPTAEFGYMPQYPSEWSNTKIQSQDPGIPAMMMVKKHTFVGFDPERPCFQDWDVAVRTVKCGRRGQLIKKLLYIAFYLPGRSITRDISAPNRIQQVLEFKKHHNLAH